MSHKKEFIPALFISFMLLGFLFSFTTVQGAATSSGSATRSGNLTTTPTQISNSDSSNLSISSIQPGMTSTSSPSQDYIVGQTDILTETLTPTATSTFTPTFTSTYTSTTTSQSLNTYLLPFISIKHDIPVVTPSPVVTVPYCATLIQPINIPDNNSTGINDFITISEDRLLVGLSVYLDVTHAAVGDLVVKLTNEQINKTITLVDRPGNQTNQCSENNIVAILDDGAAQPVDDQCASEAPAISGIYLPMESLGTFSRMIPSGTWKLNVSDNESSNIGSLNNWCLVTKLSNLMPSPTPQPPPGDLPPSAYIDGMTGQGQYFNLDCESRSAVDWAKHFGKSIDELEFFYNLPSSDDDPEVGFVGAPNGHWGNIPPDDYGVHALPIADLLRDYGLPASPYKYLRWDDIRAEIAAGNPVIVWIIGNYSSNLVNGIPHLYTPSNGEFTIVAPYEHTVVVVGYSPTDVNVLNGSHILSIPLDQFLDSWSVLQFMAVLARP